MVGMHDLDVAELEQVQGGMWIAICLVGGFIFGMAAFS